MQRQGVVPANDRSESSEGSEGNLAPSSRGSGTALAFGPVSLRTVAAVAATMRGDGAPPTAREHAATLVLRVEAADLPAEAGVVLLDGVILYRAGDGAEQVERAIMLGVAWAALRGTRREATAADAEALRDALLMP